MGIDSQLLISSKYSVVDVVKLLGGLGIKVTEQDHKGDHSFVSFDQGGLLRTLYVGKSYSSFDGLILSYRSNPEGIELFRRIAAVVGGMLNEQDCDNNWEMIQNSHEGDSFFILKHTILSKAIVNSNDFTNKVAAAVGYDNE